MAESDLNSPPASGVKAGEVDFVALPPGAKIGRYEVVSVLGQGGFGITYRARDLQLDRHVAIKEYLPTSLAVRQGGTTVLPRSTNVAEDFTWGRERFIVEGRTLANLHTATSIVRVFDFLEINGTAYIVMELVQGDTLDRLLKQRGPLGPEAIDAILMPLLDGLAQVHEAGFLHRDIKPANILLSAGGKPTLIDFGASRAAMAGRTAAMTAIFTPGYAAAEQMTSAKQGPWTDIYGLSATMYHAITGKPPASAFDRMLDDDYEPLAKRAPAGFAAGLLIGIDAGLSVRAAERPQSIAGWRPLLSQTAAADSGATVALSRTADATVVSRQPAVAVPPAPAPAPSSAQPSVSSAPTAEPPARSRTGLYAAIAAVVLLAAGAGAYVAFSPKAPSSVAVQDMKVEELEKVLEARRKAEAEAADKRRLEEDAQRKAAADAAAKSAADADVQRAQQQRQKAEEDLAKLRAEIETQRKTASEQRAIAEAEEARRKAEAEMALLRQAEEDAKRRAAVEAETKRLADEALARAQAERLKAEADAKARTEEEAKRKAEADSKTRAEAEARAKADAEAREKTDAEAKLKAEAEAKLKAEAETDRKTAEAAETALRLGVPERQRVQVALTALGFDTRGSDGALGPRSREMIAGWQKARSQPATGYLNGTQHQTLLREAGPALLKYDDEQKKTEEAKKKAEEEAQQKTAAAAPVPAAPGAPQPAPSAPGAGFDGTYRGSLFVGGTSAGIGALPTTLRVAGPAGTGSGAIARCGAFNFSIRVAANGDVSGEGDLFDPNCGKVPMSIRGKIANGQAQLTFSGSGRSISGTLALGAAAPAAASAAPAASPGGAGQGFDGTYAGSVSANFNTITSSAIQTTLRVSGSAGTGSISLERCGAINFSVRVAPNGDISGDSDFFELSCGKAPGTVRGKIVNKQVQISISSMGKSISGTLARQ